MDETPDNKKYKSSCNNRLHTVQVKSFAINNGFDEDNLRFLHRDCPLCMKEYNSNIQYISYDDDTKDDNININKITICNPCKHPFCIDCLCSTLKTTDKCPICRTEIDTIIIKDKNQIIVEKTYFEFCQENNINSSINEEFDFGTPPNFQFNNFFTNQFPNFGGFGNNYILQEIEIKNSIPISGLININQNGSDYVVLNTNNVLSFITNSLVNEENNDDIICILDNSGSMEDNQKLNKSIEGIISIINSMKTFQRISIVTFSNEAKHIFPLQQITSSNRHELISILQNIVVEGSTMYNNALNSIKKIFDESASKDETERKRIVLFFSDGDHSDTPNLSILDQTFSSYPELLFYTISIGNDIDSSVNLIPLHRNRPVELGRYFDCPDMENFTEIIQNIIGNSKPLFAKNICITFEKDIKLFTTYEQILNDDETISIKIPIVNIGDVLNIAFKNNNIVERNVKISYTFTRVCDNTEINGISVFDENNVLPKEITIDYPNSRYILDEFNTIINSNILRKEDMLTELRKNVNIENHGIYYEMLLDTINSSIEIQNNVHTPMNVLNRNVSMRQSSNTQTSPNYIAHCVSNTIFTNSVLDDDDNI